MFNLKFLNSSRHSMITFFLTIELFSRNLQEIDQYDKNKIKGHMIYYYNKENKIAHVLLIVYIFY